MYLKTVILLFCLTLYFLQCQGGFIPGKDREIISYIVEKYANPNGIDNKENGDLNLIGVKEVINDVEGKIQTNKALSSVEELQEILSNYVFTLDDVETYVAEYTGRILKPGMFLNELRKLFNAYRSGSKIQFLDLNDLLGQLLPGTKYVKAGGFPYLKFPKIAIPYKIKKSENKFTKEEVEFIVAAYFFPEIV
ncbi:uncharacterized protein LOC126837319 [Adelges cooleyi]|uniref:uncharacterized protein LOC126837319 n=1 Tax=Adelges cooleyi TaxID=133065 RepID=UPI00217F855D|nr:uncharacterized protein LOC126837319 [Adelges cooleyi]